MERRAIASAVTAIAVATLVAASGAPTAPRARHHVPPAPPSRSTPGFYPDNVEGGVPGNLSFNNQLRKFSDPLGANGGR